jgi:DNA invertase Pin-like site-specific DNA recombinase
MTKAFAYLRVSGKGQIDGDGFARQKAAIRDYAAKNNIRVVKWFEERGVSGTKDLDDRPALSELMVALHSNGVKTVLIEKLDRLARDLMIQESIIADMRRSGLNLIPVLEPDLLQDDPSRKLIRQILGAFAEYEKSMIVLKLRGARQRIKAKGQRVEGAKPYGELPGEWETLDRMKKLRAEGLGFDRIAARLNQEGLKPRSGKQWFGGIVNRILTRA